MRRGALRLLGGQLTNEYDFSPLIAGVITQAQRDERRRIRRNRQCRAPCPSIHGYTGLFWGHSGHRGGDAQRGWG